MEEVSFWLLPEWEPMKRARKVIFVSLELAAAAVVVVVAVVAVVVVAP